MHDADLGRVTISNDDGDVYVESTGEDSEIVLKTQKVRVLGDVYYNDLNVGFSARLDAVDETLTNRIDTLDTTQLELRGVDAGLSIRIDALDDSKAELQQVDTEVASLIASLNATDVEMKAKDTALSGRIDTLNATDVEMKAKDTALSGRIDALNATDAALKTTDASLSMRIDALNATDAKLEGVDDGLSSRIDALTNIYVNELNVTDKQLIVTDATLGSRVDALNATQYELRGNDTALGVRVSALETAKSALEQVDVDVRQLIGSLNATDATMHATDDALSSRIEVLNATDAALNATDTALSGRIDALNATDAALKTTDTELSGRISALAPSVCTPPGGYRLYFDGTKWLCTCSENWMGEMCDTKIPMTAELVKLTPSGSSQYADFFGHAVAISNDTVIIGAYKDDENGVLSGSAYVFVRSDMTWIHGQKLSPSDASGGGQKKFGNAVSISGNVAIIAAYDEDQPGAPDAGTAYVFLRSGNTWTQQQKLLPMDVMAYTYFGSSVAVSGDSVFITSGMCTSCRSQTGAVYIFMREEIAWSQRQKLTFSGTDGFGSSISVSGDTVVIGAPGEHSKDGAAYVFVRVGASWILQQKLQASNGTSGAQFGISVAVSGDTAMIGANLDSINAYRAGSVYIFVRSEMTWTLQQKLLPHDEVYEGRFGGLVAISEDRGIVSAWSSPAASAYVYVRSGTNWTQQGKLIPSDGKKYFAANAYAVAIAMSDGHVVVGLPDNHVRGNAYVFK